MKTGRNILRGIASCAIGAYALIGSEGFPQDNLENVAYASEVKAPYKLMDSVGEQYFFTINKNSRVAYDLKFVDRSKIYEQTPEFKTIKRDKLRKGETAKYDILVADASQRVSDTILKKMKEDGIGIVLVDKELLKQVEGLEIDTEDEEALKPFDYTPTIIEEVSKSKESKYQRNFFKDI